MSIYPKSDYWDAQSPEFREEALGHVITMEREYAWRQRVRAERAERAVEAVRALVMNTDGDYLDGEDFDGLAGCIQQALAQHGFLGGKA